MVDSLKILKIKGTMFQMGKDYGKQSSDLITNLLASTKKFYKNIGYSRDDIQKIRVRHEEGIGRVAPELIEEISGMADGASVPYEDMMEASLLGPIGDALRHRLKEGCSISLATGRATSTGNPILGHNWDSQHDPKTIVVTIAKPKKGLGFVTIGPIGRPGCEGMNEKGLTILMSGVQQERKRESLDGTGPLYVSPLWTHHILESCSTVDEAVRYGKDTYRKSIHGQNWVVGDSDSFAHMEISFNQIKVKHFEPESSDPKNCVLSTTNHYISPELNSLGPSIEKYPNTYARLKRMNSLLQSNIGKIDLNLVKTFHRDHHRPHPICRHHDTTSKSTTIFSEIGEPKELRFWIAPGPPCENEYQVFSLSELF